MKLRRALGATAALLAIVLLVAPAVGAMASGVELVSDEFDSASYDGNNGTARFSGPWREIGESDGAGSGRVQVTRSGSCSEGRCLQIVGSATAHGATRTVDLSRFPHGTLSFSLAQNGAPGDGALAARISNDGGRSWITLATFPRQVHIASPEFGISRYASSNTVWDSHTHTGHSDPDGVVGTPDRLLQKLAVARQAGAVLMSNQDPNGYPAANDRILREAAASNGRLVPFLRVDPQTGSAAVAETQRSLAAGHRGIKLHPRAESFRLGDPTVRRVMEMAAERGVPVVSHAGRGIPSLGADAVKLCDEIDGLTLILAHAAISDLSWLGPVAADHPGLYFDAAWWDISDLIALFAWVPPGRILYASDTPYGHPSLSFVLTMRVAAAAGYDSDQLNHLFGDTLWRLLESRGEAELGPAAGNGFLTRDPGLLRVYASLHGAIVRAFSKGETAEPVALARLACDVGPGAAHEEVFRAIAATIDLIDLTTDRRSQVVRPLLMAASAALTPNVAVPAIAAE